jgi:hypothetical protein
MDVLKEIAMAEKKAAEIENEYSQRVKAIESSLQARLGEAREGLESELKAEAQALRERREKGVDEEKKVIAARSAEEKESLRKRSKDGEPGAVDILLKKLGY